MAKLIYPTASVRLHSTDAIGIAQVSGVVTLATAGALIGDSHKWVPGGALCNLVLYDGASMAVELDALLPVAQAAKRIGAQEATPAALVVGRDSAEMFRAYAAAMGAKGALIGVFTDREKARRWVAQQAQVREHWRQLRRGLQSGS